MILRTKALLDILRLSLSCVCSYDMYKQGRVERFLINLQFFGKYIGLNSNNFSYFSNTSRGQKMLTCFPNCFRY